MKNDSTKFATISDVAKIAKVSPVTVSRVYNPKWKGKIKQSTIDKVLEAANQLCYTPNGVARSLTSHKTNIIAVVVGPDSGYFYDSVLKKLMDKIQLSGRQPLIFVTAPTISIKEIVAQVQMYRVDAIIVTSPATKDNIADYFTGIKIPLILFNRTVTNSNASAVWGDNVKAAEDVADLLVKNKHKKIAYISAATKGERNEAFVNRLSEYHMKPILIEEGDYTYETGYEIAMKMLKSTTPPDAIFCSGDNMAMGALDAARLSMGLKVPKDLSIVGFDNNPVAQMKAYELTTVSYPLDSMIQAIIDIVEKLLINPDSQILKEFKLELIIGKTVKIYD
ncbi:LacI family DNA-binding transcriptional regulator [Clostridium grantii]|uniref:DNA-binding transcriptional regulator, LacI/PurR family n=1 Tax=Clostridium grantii DSM 8605 TaxID=1121316 RepID=A0A1M5VUW4_9CLOT|nr:LacI family DNA-binding transcriptional regulator [Clostridium grantii]SHH79052.1 DNA-binding transcriptional regulator, LacI/PurR family [Clostridium grantii DSM 8605]